MFCDHLFVMTNVIYLYTDLKLLSPSLPVMDYNELKNLMRNHLGYLIDSHEFEHLFVDDPEKEYPYRNDLPMTRCNGFTHLHKCIMLGIVMKIEIL